MDLATIACRHSLLLAEIERRMTLPGAWRGLPGLLDELHGLRRQYEAAARLCDDTLRTPADACNRYAAFGALPAKTAAVISYERSRAA